MATKDEIMGILNKLIAQYEAGTFGKGEEALLGRAKKKSLASTSQSLVSSGLANTTMGAGAGQKWEEEVGMPSRLTLERQRMTGMSAALAAKAGYLQSSEGQDKQLAAAAAQNEVRNKQIEAQRKSAALAARLRYAASRGGGSPTNAEDIKFWENTGNLGGGDYGSQGGGDNRKGTHGLNSGNSQGQPQIETVDWSTGKPVRTLHSSDYAVKPGEQWGYKSVLNPGETQPSGAFDLVPTLNYKMPTKMEMLNSIGKKWMNQTGNKNQKPTIGALAKVGRKWAEQPSWL